MKNNSPTNELANFIVNMRFTDLSKEQIDAAKRCFLDWLGVTIGGIREPPAKILVDLIEELGGKKQASVIGYGRKTSILNAALVNGTMAHSLDYDDAHMYTRNHPSAPLIAALLPVSEYKKLPGTELITAFILGFEVSTRIGLALGNDYYDLGWHATPVLGRFGVAAGVGKLLGLDTEKLKNAFGLAATQTGGIRKVFGTMGKPFHAGKAAMDGILSTILADKGFTAPKDILDEDSGFLGILSSKIDLDQITSELGEKFHVFDVSFKPHAACLAMHPPIDGLISIRNEYRIDPENIDRIDLEVAPICLVLGDNKNPESGLEGKFSVYYCAALAVTEGQARNNVFSDEMIRATHIRRLMEKTVVKGNESFQESEAKIKVVSKDGGLFEKHIIAPKGDPRNPLNFDEIVEKFTDLSKCILPENNVEQIVSLIQNLEKLENIMELIRICCPEKIL
ncbi:MmgE/PrpD family protein [Thermodesulfobacteriota bacterium]